MENKTEDLNIRADCERSKAPFMEKRGGRTMDIYALSFITHGEGFFEDKEGRVSVTPGQVMIQPDGIWHCTDPTSAGGWDEYWVCFNLLEAERRFGQIIPRSPGVFSITRPAALEEIWKELCDLVYLRIPFFQEYTALLLHRLLIHLFQERNGDRVLRRHQGITAAEREIRRTFREEMIDWEKIADLSGMGYDVFRQRFRRETGLAPKQYLIELKLLHAASLIRDTNLPIKEIAAEVGMTDPYYFSRLFQKRMGVPPRTYRLRHRTH